MLIEEISVRYRRDLSCFLGAGEFLALLWLVLFCMDGLDLASGIYCVSMPTLNSTKHQYSSTCTGATYNLVCTHCSTRSCYMLYDPRKANNNNKKKKNKTKHKILKIFKSI